MELRVSLHARNSLKPLPTLASFADVKANYTKTSATEDKCHL